MSDGTSVSGRSAKFALVVPAHNDEANLKRLLVALTDPTIEDDIEIIVVVNGSTDRSVEMARSFRAVTTIELEVASKVEALNAGDLLTSTRPIIYLDADVTITARDLKSLARALEEYHGPVVASPSFTVDTDQSPMLLRSFYRAWGRTNFRLRGHIGSGCYGLNAAGRQRFGKFPQVIADDRFVQLLFSAAETLQVENATFSVQAPKLMTAFLRRGIRIRRGNSEVLEYVISRPATAIHRDVWSLVMRSFTGPQAVVDLCVYFALTILIRVGAWMSNRSKDAIAWSQDRSTRIEA